jgi:hypothetical protein
MDGGQIAGLVVGIIAAIALLGLALSQCYRGGDFGGGSCCGDGSGSCGLLVHG